MEPVFVVISKDSYGKLRPCEVFTERRLADNFAEIKRSLDTTPTWEYFVIEGTMPETHDQRIQSPKEPVKSYEHPIDHAHIQE